VGVNDSGNVGDIHALPARTFERQKEVVERWMRVGVFAFDPNVGYVVTNGTRRGFLFVVQARERKRGALTLPDP
jgi:hypothetical protein